MLAHRRERESLAGGYKKMNLKLAAPLRGAAGRLILLTDLASLGPIVFFLHLDMKPNSKINFANNFFYLPRYL